MSELLHHKRGHSVNVLRYLFVNWLWENLCHV
nr:MAG TPA: hypothetical protein [Caudoviricetes sp.]